MFSVGNVELSWLTRKGSECKFFSKKSFLANLILLGIQITAKKSKKACLEVELWSFEVGKFTHKSNAVLLPFTVLKVNLFKYLTTAKLTGLVYEHFFTRQTWLTHL